MEHTDSPLPWKYEIMRAQIKDTTIDGEEFKGFLSPTSSITLPPMARKQAKIPPNATSFAFMHPPEGLAKRFADAVDSEHTCVQTLHCNDKEEAMTSAVIMGGFAYFDKDFKCIRINALSRTQSKDTLFFSGPFEVAKSACVELYKTDRTQPQKIGIYREGGFVRIAWVHPKETFQFESVFYSKKKECVPHENNHGSFLFFRENGTAVGYAIDESRYTDPSGDVGVIAEIFGNCKDVGNIDDARLDDTTIDSIYKVRAWGNKIKYVMGKSIDTTTLTKELKDKRTLLHWACHADLGVNIISDLLSNMKEKDNLSYEDNFGWTPLHYACRFSPNDYNLIKLLLKECPGAAMKSDHSSRYPLHIACDSDASKDVIAELLAVDKSRFKVTLLSGTRTLGLLPIHFACFNGASDIIVRTLLDADKDGRSAVKTTLSGQLPLHLAIIKKLPASVVKLFLDGDLRLRRTHKHHRSDLSDTSQLNADVHQFFDEKLPLHLACWNNSSVEIIEMLLAKDECNATIHAKLHASLEDLPFSIESLNCSSEKCLTSRNSMYDPITGRGESGLGGVALHLAIKHGSSDVIGLLLQKNAENSVLSTTQLLHLQSGNETEEPITTLHRRDLRGRTPLHVACENNVDPQIIRLLLKLDASKKTTQMSDEQGFRPLHYACENEKARAETVNILCDTEEQYITQGSNENERSAYVRDNKRNRTPLYIAIKSRAPIEIIERLLQPENFFLRGFDDSALADLAEYVRKSKKLQNTINDRLLGRSYFFLILSDLYATWFALVFLVIGSRQLVDSALPPVLLIIASTVFVLREFLEMASFGTDYVLNARNFIDLSCIGFLCAIAAEMLQKNVIPVYVYSVAGFLLIVKSILYFRATFITFARFVGGFLVILKKLMPFIIVSLLLVLAFAYMFFVTENQNCDVILSCFIWTLGGVFEFEFSALKGEGALNIIIGTLFTFIILIVLLNVVIAIVSDAWYSTTSDLSTQLFWKYRLEMMTLLNGLADLDRKVKCLSIYKECIALPNGDFLWHASLGSNCRTFWTHKPYNIVIEKKQYDEPHEYFSTEVADQINMAKSLSADLYWFKKEKGESLTRAEKFCIIYRWLVSVVLYSFLVILGFIIFGITWPTKFRRAVLNLNSL